MPAKPTAAEMRIDPVYSRDDCGHYAEVINTRTGATLYTTDVYKSHRSARSDAQTWINQNAAPCTHNAMTERPGDDDHAWQCADCAHIYGHDHGGEA